MDEEERKELLSEEVSSKLDTIMEILEELQGVPAHLKQIDRRLDNIETDVGLVKQIIKQHSKDIERLKT